MSSTDVNAAGSQKKAPRLALTPLERKASIRLGLLFATRMFGLFLLTPVFAVLAQSIPVGNDSLRVGIALGTHGLHQAVMQITLGLAAERLCRRLVVGAGLGAFRNWYVGA